MITGEDVASMRPGSVIVDMAAADSGNVVGTVAGEKIVTDNGVTIRRRCRCRLPRRRRLLLRPPSPRRSRSLCRPRRSSVSWPLGVLALFLVNAYAPPLPEHFTVLTESELKRSDRRGVTGEAIDVTMRRSILSDQETLNIRWHLRLGGARCGCGRTGLSRPVQQSAPEPGK
ncbi:hypothetical protein ACQP1W_27520 [Spirillospora sp. CA-255316]